jgi:hypothetical protein
VRVRRPSALVRAPSPSVRLRPKGEWAVVSTAVRRSALFDVQAAIFPGIGVFAAALLVGVIVPARADGWMPGWVAAVGAAAATAELVSVPVGVIPTSWLFSALTMPGYLLVLLWMISTSIVLLRTPACAAVPAAA